MSNIIDFEIRGKFYADTPLRIRDRLDRIREIVERTIAPWDGEVTGHQMALPGELQEKRKPEYTTVYVTDYEIITGPSMTKTTMTIVLEEES